MYQNCSLHIVSSKCQYQNGIFLNVIIVQSDCESGNLFPYLETAGQTSLKQDCSDQSQSHSSFKIDYTDNNILLKNKQRQIYCVFLHFNEIVTTAALHSKKTYKVNNMNIDSCTYICRYVLT